MLSRFPDGWIPSIPVSGSAALPLLERGASKLASLSERQIIIIAADSLLPASGSEMTIPKHRHLPGGTKSHRAFSVFKQNNHVFLPHENTVANIDYPRG